PAYCCSACGAGVAFGRVLVVTRVDLGARTQAATERSDRGHTVFVPSLRAALRSHLAHALLDLVDRATGLIGRGAAWVRLRHHTRARAATDRGHEVAAAGVPGVV